MIFINNINFQTIIATSISNNSSNYKTIDYYARFNCGSINDDNGPLRPGKYDSDITVFNKQSYPITISWKAIKINQETKSNFNILTIPSENIVNINCAKIFPNAKENVNNNLSNFIEGVVKIQIRTSNGLLVNNLLSSQGESILIQESELGNLINVDVLHTVNTLSELNKELFYLKTEFSVDLNTKLENLTAIFPILPNEIINPKMLILEHLSKNASEYNIGNTTINDIKIENSDIVTNVLVDNHALTVQRVESSISQ